MIEGRLPLFKAEHLLSLQSMSLQSPFGIEGTGAAEAVRSLGDALSIGKQLQDIRTSSLVVVDKKLELRRKEMELEKLKRDHEIALQNDEIRSPVETAKLELELERTRNDLEEQRSSGLGGTSFWGTTFARRLR